jgi:Sec-independent protein translocase protein TatA
MEILGIGPLEFVFILLIALLVLGPTDMVKAGRTIGRFLRNLVMSPGWKSFQQASRDLRTLPNKLMRDAGLEEELQAVQELTRQTRLPSLGSTLDSISRDISPWTTPPPENNSSAEKPIPEDHPESAAGAPEETGQG